MNLDYIQVPLMLKAYLVEGLSVNAGVQVGFLCGDGKVKREETDLQKDKTGLLHTRICRKPKLLGLPRRWM